jgi:hypothetical protein
MLKASSFGMSAVTLITFGGPSTPGVTARLSGGASPLAAGELLSADIDRLASGVPGSVLGIVSTDVLPLDDAEAVVLSRLYERGVPFLLRMDSQEPDDIKRVSSIFGITPTAGDVILRRDRDGFTQVFSGGASAATTADLLSAVVKPIPATTSLAGNRLTSRSAVATQVSVQQNDDSKPSYPSRRFGLNFVDGDGEISGSSVIDVVRIRTNSADAKAVMVTSSNVTVKTNKNGTVDGTKTQKNLWGAYLPHQYRLSHTLKAENGVTPSYRNHYPLSDDRIEYTTTETRTGGFTIGGSTGSELSATGKADDALAAKMPLNLSASYDYNWSESLSTTFKDYSINSRAVGVDSVEWQALIAPRLRGVLVNRAGAGLPQLTEDKMTSTMRSITFNTQSEWILPGDYEDGLTVSVSGGYDLQRSEWWWERTNLRTRSVQDKRDVPASYVIDMSDPYLTADITVLLRSATGMGECLRDDINVVLVPCDKMDRRQMWGLDPSSRYVNRASGRCLTADSQTRAVVTQSCRISFEQQWQWRADRLHSFIDQAQYRLYVEGGQVRYHAAEGRFQDYPVNPHGTPLEPWTNYPSSPRVGIDHQPAPFGATPRPITPEWASQFRPVSTDQRWHIEVLRQGL